jgi:hypothetical protein
VTHAHTKYSNLFTSSFIYPPSCYTDSSTSENIVFNTRVQLFSEQVAYISGLEASGQISAKLAYKQIKSLWKQLKRFKKQLKSSQHIGNLITYPGGKNSFYH